MSNFGKPNAVTRKETETWSMNTPCGKFRKYCHMRQLSENTFQSFNMEVYEKIFF